MSSRTPALLLVTALLFSSACQPPSAADDTGIDEGATLLNRTMALTDPNRDPNWDWTLNVTYDLQTTSQTYYGVRLPYYSNSGPASVLNISGDRDILPQDGWRLVLRDFGPGAVQAFFILYNKHRGVLRVFYYHPNNSHTYAIGKLHFQQATSDKSAALFTLSDSTDRYIQNYGPERNAVAVGALGSGWCYLDFDASGYDPQLHLKDDPTLTVEITGVTQTAVVLNGEINLMQRTAVAQRDNSSGFNATDLVDAYKHVAQRYKDVEDARKKYEEMAKNNTGKWWSNFVLNTLGNAASKSWLSALGPIAGLIELAIGGGSSSNRQPVPLILDGDLALNGQLTTNSPLYILTLRAPGANHIDPVNDALSNVLPLYDLPLGLFNVATAPTYNLYHQQTITNRWQNIWTGRADAINTVPLVVEVNLNVFQVASARAAYVMPDWLTDSNKYRSVGTFNSGTVTDFYSAYGLSDPFASYWYPAVAGRKLAIMMTLTPLDAVAGVEPVTVLKTYQPSYTIANRTPPSFPSRAPARPSSLVASASGPNQINLRWFDNAGNEASILVEQRLGAGAWSQIASLSANTVNFSVTSLNSQTPYEYRVRSRNSAGYSSYSNIARAKTH
ncbi:MAG: fibronectin type III domain-containing protein [Myxococcaceae bacterium]|nr:fibronectin type III domain-containing protein [Myxococcaceae bacterium]